MKNILLILLISSVASAQGIPDVARLKAAIAGAGQVKKEVAREISDGTRNFVRDGVIGATEIINAQNAQGIPVALVNVSGATQAARLVSRLSRYGKATPELRSTPLLGAATGVLQGCKAAKCGGHTVDVLTATESAAPKLLSPPRMHPFQAKFAPPPRGLTNIATPKPSAAAIMNCPNCGSNAVAQAVQSGKKISTVVTSEVVVGGRFLRSIKEYGPKMSEADRATSSSAVMKAQQIRGEQASFGKRALDGMLRNAAKVR